MKRIPILIPTLIAAFALTACGESNESKTSYAEAMKRCEPEIKRAASAALNRGGDVMKATDDATRQCLKKHGIGHTH